MVIKFIKGNYRYQFLNGIVNSTNDGVILGNCYIDIENGNKRKSIRIVKQDRWYLYIPIMIHEFAHYLVDWIFPFMGDNEEVLTKHNLVDVIFDLNVMYFIKGGK